MNEGNDGQLNRVRERESREERRSSKNISNGEGSGCTEKNS